MSAHPRSSSKSQQKSTSVSTEALRRFVRARAGEFLADPNITSVGVGYKIVDGKTTGDVAVQFTVSKKVAPESLESLGTALLPESVAVDGFEIPTDVVERTYELSYRIVAEADTVSSTARTRHDPVRPGISVGHVDISAGTIGVIVYDRSTGAPLVLSNWRVLHGPEGKLRDGIVQPGAYDDDRVEDNAMGRLYRSHLGVAGDCAVATIDGRGSDPSILDIDVAPTELGDPDLGDKVIKSGRTTGVTHGIRGCRLVRRGPQWRG